MALEIPFHRIKEGSNKGCQFCGLLVDAITTWGKEQGVDGLVSELYWVLKLRYGQFLVEVGLCDHDNLSIFRGTGMSIINCAKSTIKENTGFQSQWNIQEQPPKISGDTSCSAAVTTARRWLEDCRYNHVLCQRKNNVQKVPTRILEYDGNKLRLCDNPEPTITYACLSHCWGPCGPATQLRPDTMADLKAGFPMDTLPKTFRDAAWFCWRLGIHYIWIDALCKNRPELYKWEAYTANLGIIQGDEADWEEAAATMADVYESAAITISAAWSKSSEDGCFAPAMHDIALSEGGLYVRNTLEEFPVLLNSSQWPLFQRAWIYQERIMSTRILHFGKQQLFWECNSKLHSESDLEGYKPDIHSLKSTEVEEDPEFGWRTAVTHYSGLRLTYEKDRLPAISACVKRMQRLRRGDVYIAGMWKKTLRYDLCWYPGFGRRLARPDRPGTVMPSWSWISTSSGAIFRHRIVPILSPGDINVAYNITGPAHIGQVSHASIQLKARFMFVKPELIAWHPFNILEHPHGIWENDGPPMRCVGGGWDFDHTTADPPIHANETFVALLLSKGDVSYYLPFSYFGIVLRELANKKFERVGHIHIEPPSVSESEPESESTPEPELEPAWLMELPIGQFTIV
jgi:hypothetical protein